MVTAAILFDTSLDVLFLIALAVFLFFLVWALLLTRRINRLEAPQRHPADSWRR